MEKLQRLSLSLIICLTLLSCNKNNLTKRELAKKKYNEAVRFTQGSIPFQNGLAEAITLDSTFTQAVYASSIAHLKRGMPHKWLPLYTKSVQLDSINRIPWRGYLYLMFYKDYKKAIADFDTSDILTPNFIDTPQGLSVDAWRGIAYLGLKNYEKSIYYFDKYLKKETADFGENYVDLNSFLYQGIAFMELKDYEKADTCFNKVIEYSYGFSSDAKYYKALILFKKDKLEEAKVMIEAALKDFNDGYFNSQPYVEVLRQLYLEDFTDLKSSINSN